MQEDLLQDVNEEGPVGPVFITKGSRRITLTTLHEGLIHSGHWLRAETLFVIDCVRKYLDSTTGPPASIRELEDRLALKRGQKKKLWQNIAIQLAHEFSIWFLPEKVRRKWAGLVESYKNIIDNNNKTGRSRMKFEFVDEMHALLGMSLFLAYFIDIIKMCSLR
jgi:hypothetical protein